jgi:hypothetical protein
VLENSVLRDHRLSLKARGLLALLLSYPDNWRASSEHLARICPDGRDSIRSAMRELEGAGYLRRRRHQDPSTGRFSTDTYVFDCPQLDGDNPAICPQPEPDYPAPDGPALLERTTKNYLNPLVTMVPNVGKDSSCGEQL